MKLSYIMRQKDSEGVNDQTFNILDLFNLSVIKDFSVDGVECLENIWKSFSLFFCMAMILPSVVCVTDA